MQNIRVIFLLFAVSLAAVVCHRADYSHNVTAPPITILSEEGPLSDHLQKMLDLYARQTGKQVKLTIRKKEIFRNEFIDEMKLRSDQFNIVLIDPLWLGYGVKNGYFIEFTNWLSQKGIDQNFHERLQKLYSEYPFESGKIWGIPVSYDGLGIIYRKDYFENPAEQKMFWEKYKRKLVPPQNLGELKELMNYFYRPEKQLYPLADFSKSSYGDLSALFYSFVSLGGGALVSQPSHIVRGYLNTKENVNVLKLMRELYKKSFPSQNDWPLDFSDKGHQVVMSFDKYSTFQKLLTRAGSTNLYGFIPFFKNEFDHRAVIKGRLFAVIGFAPNKDQTFEFLEWFYKSETQVLWSQMGEISPVQSILGGPRFYHDGFCRKELMQGIEGGQRMMMLPEYFDLVDAMDEDLVQYITNNKKDAYSVLRDTAKKWEYILEQAGYYKE